MTSHFSSCSIVNGNSASFPAILYDVAAFILSSPDNTSSFVIASELKPFNLWEYFSITRSSQPHLLGLPVVVPYSFPVSLILSPSSPWSSARKGPFPTLVVYAFTIATTSSFLGGIPTSAKTAPLRGCELVTKGYVPYAISRKTPCAPSNITFLSFASLTSFETSPRYFLSFSASAVY